MPFDFRLTDASSERRVGSPGTWRHIAALATVVALLLFFVMRFLTSHEPGWLVFVVFLLLLSLASGPYVVWIAKEQAIHYLKGDRCLAKFNDRSVPKQELGRFYQLLSQRFLAIHVPEGGPPSPTLPFMGRD